MVAGGRFELATFGLCDLTQLSLRVGLYLHLAQRESRSPWRSARNSRGLRTRVRPVPSSICVCS